jgi:hypothetical protein
MAAWWRTGDARLGKGGRLRLERREFCEHRRAGQQYWRAHASKRLIAPQHHDCLAATPAATLRLAVTTPRLPRVRLQLCVLWSAEHASGCDSCGSC